jgi:hypothetical protein
VVSGVAKRLGIQLGLELIKTALYGNMPVAVTPDSNQPANELDEYARRVEALKQRSNKPRTRSALVEQETKVLAVPQ